ncbi:hypothetical protein ASPCAL08681 [Aspergillus calidoustus]|uniref:DUF7730 domain-containing protein n=1 Tax=Aspergillus calidoustus TaxID=454130 RepID=A0A0U5GT92_ASPCI|nr:hypothetical protein ASPCAL08681 [Aspergillus calidoustus]
MAVEFNLCEVIQIMLVLGPKMLWDAIRKGTLKRNIRRSRETVFAPVIEYRERRTPLAFTPMFRRALTPPPSPSPSVEQGVPHSAETMDMHMQTQSGFSKLPIEIREMLYHGVLCVPYMHLHKDAGIARVHGGQYNYILRCLHMVDPGFYQPEPSHPGIGQLHVCRWIYSESVSILYEHNTFSLNQHALNAMPRTIIPTRLASIRKLRVYVSVTTANDRMRWIHESEILKQFTGSAA